MHSPHPHNRNSALRSLLWGLLLTKCFALEYFATKYAAPINTAFYVWSLSILMATVATAVHLKMRVAADGGVRGISAVHVAWVIAGFFVATLWIAHRQLDGVSHQLLLSLIAVVVGATSITHGRMVKQPQRVALGVAWWIGAAVLFSTAPPSNYLVFSACIFSLWVIPSLFAFVTRSQLSAVLPVAGIPTLSLCIRAVRMRLQAIKVVS